jgi:hypothetical protein
VAAAISLLRLLSGAAEARFLFLLLLLLLVWQNIRTTLQSLSKVVLFCAAGRASLAKFFTKQVTTAVQKKRTTQQSCKQFGWWWLLLPLG